MTSSRFVLKIGTHKIMTSSYTNNKQLWPTVACASCVLWCGDDDGGDDDWIAIKFRNIDNIIIMTYLWWMRIM